MSDNFSPPARLVTAFGTVVYVDTASGELRHGPVEGALGNAFLTLASSDATEYHRCSLTFVGQPMVESIACRPDRSLTISAARREDPATEATILELIPLDRGIFALRAGNVFLSAVPDGSLRLSASVCSTWELFVASEDWCSEKEGSQDDFLRRIASPVFDSRRIRSHVVHATLRARANRKPKRPKLLVYGYTAWSHGRVYYDLSHQLHRRGYIVDILDWQINHHEYIAELLSYYDVFMTALDGVSTLTDVYHIPFDRIIAISHHELDVRMLAEQKGTAVFDRFANYAVVSEYLYCASQMRGVPRVPAIAPIGINYSQFYTEVLDRLTTVGYASSMTVKTYGIEWKRGGLAEAATRDAGLEFKIAGSTGTQASFHDMPDFYRGVGAVVTSSISEAAQLPVMEGAAAGRLVIGTPVGHFPAKAYQGAGILAPVEAKKFTSFTAGTLRYYKDNPNAYVDKCHSIQEAARKSDWSECLDDWVALIDSAIQGTTPSRIVTRIENKSSSTKLSGAIICDTEWLSSYICAEHIYLITLLCSEGGFDLINSKSTDFSNEAIIARLNSYDFVLVAYQGEVAIPLDRVKTYKILRIDDLVSYNEAYDRLLNGFVDSSDKIISPYGYELKRYFHHDNVAWIPFSSSLEGCPGYEEIKFNHSPMPKILVSGSVAWDRPFRQYAATVKCESVEVLPHPGYGNRYDDSSNAPVRLNYFRELNKYLCCFCDAHSYRYIHPRNFEIACVGSLLLADRLVEPELNKLGFIDGETCLFSDKEDFLTKVRWIVDVNNRQTVDQIRLAGMRLTLERHLTRHRATELYALLGQWVSGGRRPVISAPEIE